MNIWSNAVITNKGLALQAKLVEGNTLQITKAVVGTGFVAPALLIKQTGVTGPKQTLAIQPVSYPETGKCAMTVYLTNDGVTSGYTAKQIGIYANDPDHGEILYFIAESTDEGTGTVIPSASEMPGYSGEWTFYFQYGQADGVQVEVDPTGVVCQSVFDEAMEEINEALQACKDNSGSCYCACSTVTGTATKVATVVRGNFKLETGAAVDVKFANANSAGNPTLNVNGTGAKSIKTYGTTSPNAYMWSAGAVVRFIYDGQYWLMQNGTLATTSYYGVTKLSSSVSSTAANMAATPSAVKQAYDKANAAIPKTQKGAANGVADLDADGKVPMSQIPEEVALADHTHDVATTSSDGFMSKEQVAALNGKVDMDEVKAAILAKVAEIVDAANTITFNGFKVSNITKKESVNGLSSARYNLASVDIWDYALFGGGQTSSGKSSVVDAYNSSATRVSAPALNASGRGAATEAGRYSKKALFVLGASTNPVNVYDTSLVKSTAEALGGNGDISTLAATCIMDFALFGGGSRVSGPTDYMVAYNTSLTKFLLAPLSLARYGCTAAAIPSYGAIFAGGQDSNWADAYDTNLSKIIVDPLSGSDRNYPGALSPGGSAVFAGGGSSKFVDYYSSSGLTKLNAPNLSIGRGYLAASHVNNVTFFAGGQYGNISYDIVDVYRDNYFTKGVSMKLTEVKYSLCGSNISNVALFAGGYNTKAVNTMDAFYLPDTTSITVPAFSRYYFQGLTDDEELACTEREITTDMPLTGYIKRVTNLVGAMPA